jgi:hypothetical protein
MSKQTAVEYLQNELWSNYEFKSSKQKREFVSKIEQAKAMEKEQIEKAHGNKIRQDIEHSIDVYLITTGDQYYNETYGGDK